MANQFTIKFSEDLVKHACQKFFLRYLGFGFPIAFCLIAVVLVQLFLAGKTDWLFGALLVVLVMGTSLFTTAYFQRLNSSLSEFRKIVDGTVHYELTDERFKAMSSLGSTEVKWEVFKSLWIFPRVWLLMFDKAAYMSLPADQLTEEVKEFLKQKIAAVGGKIT